MFKNEEKKAVTEMVNSSNVIAKETKIVGEIIALGNIRIEGQVEGTLKSEKKVVIGDSARITGNITAVEVEISGTLEGTVECSEALFLKKTAVIKGDMITKKLVVENGAVFNGKCQMTEVINVEASPKAPKNNHEQPKEKVLAK